jgi:hypothetical protein
MATFSVDITEVYFAGQRTGYKDITIQNMPEGGVSCFMYSGSGYFGFTAPGSGDDETVYRVYTKAQNTSIDETHRGTFRIRNANNYSDYVDVSLVQYTSRAKRIYILPSEYSNLYVRSNEIYAEYTKTDYVSHIEVWVDGYVSMTVSDSWIIYNTEMTYTDTGFKRLWISTSDNYDSARRGTVSFDGSTTALIVIQNGYPSSTSGCTGSITFQKEGGTIRVTINHPSSIVYENIGYSGDLGSKGFTSPTYTKVRGDSTTTYYDIAVGVNSANEALKGVVKFYRSAVASEVYGFTIVNQEGQAGPVQTLYVDPSVLGYTEEGGGKVLDVTYEAPLTTNEASAPSWLTINSVNIDQTHKSYTISASQNDTLSARNFDFELEDANGSVTVPITQAAGQAASLSVSPSSSTVTAASGSTQVTVTSTHISSVSYVISDEWIYQVVKNGDVYTLRYTANPGTTQRQATVTFYGDGLSSTYTLTQEAAAASLVITPAELHFDDNGGTKTIVASSYTGSIHLDMSNCPDWVTEVQVTQGGPPTTYYVTVAANTGSGRQWNARFYDSNNNQMIIPVTQGAAVNPLSVTPSSLSFIAGGETKSATLSNVPVGGVSINSPSWIVITEDPQTYVLSVRALSNSGNSRNGTVTIYGFYDSSNSCTITISQAGSSPSPTPTPEVNHLKASPSKLRFLKEGDYEYVSFNYIPESGIDYNISYNEGSGWLTVTSSGNRKVVTASPNTTGVRRRATLMFYEHSDSTNYDTLKVIQGGDGYDSIWMDQLYYPQNRDENDNFYYRLTYGTSPSGAELFRGISTVPSGGGGDIGGIDIPRLVESHMLSNLNTSTNWRGANGYITVGLFDMTSGGYPGTLVDSFKYWNDWSRTELRYDYTRYINDPINGKGCDGMIIPVSVYYDDAATFTIVETGDNGTVNDVILPAPVTPFAQLERSFYNLNRVDFKQDADIIFSYDLEHCGPGAFIYRNRYGGWDSFLIEGNVSKTDSYEKLDYRTEGEMTHTGFDARFYQNIKHTDSVNIVGSYVAHTGWLTDEEAERLVFHLLSSPTVYYQRFNEDDYDTAGINLLPVTIKESSAEYKKFRNGRKLVNYVITFEENNIQKVRY